MSYQNGLQYTDFRRINLKAEGGVIRFEDITTVPTTATGEYLLYVDGGVLYYDNGSGTVALGAAGGSGSISWEQMYATDNTINIASGSGLTIAGAMANSNDVLTVSQAAGGSGDVIKIQNAGTGKDISGTDDTWHITKAGVATFAELVLTSTVSTDVFAVTNDSITANNAFLVTGSGVFTGTGANSFANVTASGLTTGTALTVIANGATTSVGVFDVSGTAMTSGSLVRLTGGGANISSGGKVLEVAMGAATTGAGVSITTSGVHQGTTTNSIFVINSAGDTGTASYIVANSNTTGVVSLITSSGTMTTSGSLLTLTANSATTAAGLLRINGNGLTSGIGAIIASSATAITGNGRLFKIDHTGATTTSGTLVEFATSATDETVVVKITTAAMVDGVGLSIVGTTGMTTGSLLRATTSTAGIVATNGVYSLRGTGAHTSTSYAGLLDVQSSGMVGTAANSTLVNFMATAAAQVDTTILNVEASGFTTGFTGSMVRIKSPTTTGAGKVIEVIADGITSGGTAMSISVAALTTGDGLVISNGTAATTTGSLLKVTAGGTGAVSADGIVSFAHTGIYTSSTVGFVNILTSGTTAGTTLSVTASAATTGVGVLVATDALTEGTALKITAVEATLTTGLYIQCYDGAANDFSVAKYGATVIAGNAALTASLTLTKGDFLMSDGVLRAAVTATITADAGSIQGGSPLTRSFNEIAVSGTTGDSVTLPAAAAGQFVLITNHGANSADVFPASGDAINEASANAAKALAADASMMCYSYDATNWECLTLAR